MTLIVDFNMIEEDGRVPALLNAEQISLVVEGAKVLAADGEGTECQAVVSDVSPDRGYVMLAPVDGTWNRDSKVRPSIGGTLAQ